MIINTLSRRCFVGVVAISLFIPLAAKAQEQVEAQDQIASARLSLLEAPGPTVPAESHKGIVDRKFVVTGVLLMGLTIADLERTQRCLGQHTCVEMNPMLPHSRAGMYAVNIPMNAAAMYLGYCLKAKGRKSWLVAPGLMTAGHLLGAAWRM